MTDKTKFERDVQREHHAKSVRMTNADVADEPGSSQYMAYDQKQHRTQPESVIQVSDSMQEVPTAGLPSDPAHAATDPSRLEAQALETLWEKLRKGRERLHPFGEQDGGEYIFLEPKDLLTFQDNGKYLVNNSFLLHGFYNYGHILLGTQRIGSRAFSSSVAPADSASWGIICSRRLFAVSSISMRCGYSFSVSSSWL